MFRIAAALEQAGHTCVIYLHDQHGWELEQHRRPIRGWWPWLHADVRILAAGMDDSHIVLATAWQRADPVLACPARGTRCCFVQDFEPAFHPAGSIAMLAESTYRFGFHGVTAGRWLAQRLREEYGMSADHCDFGCDLGRYALDGVVNAADARTGVCYYCRPSTPRRAHELAVLALELLAARHPEVDIHLFGEPRGRLPFAATHGLLTPEQLSTLYNRCIAGLTLSATNVSLVPREMLAAGCVPVVNDAEHNRLVLDNAHVEYAPGNELAAAVCALVRRPPAASVRTTTWRQAGAQVERILVDLVGARAAAEIAA